MRSIKLGVIMDDIETINIQKDSTLAMLIEAAKRQYELYYIEQKNLYFNEDRVCAQAAVLDIHPDKHHWFDLKAQVQLDLGELDILLMRKDPPFNLEYIYTTYLLDLLAAQKVLVVNHPQGLRDANEKLFITRFPTLIPDTTVTRSKHVLNDFWLKHRDIVCKPLHTMGGAFVFRLQADDVNAHTIFETLTADETQYIMAQRYIPEIIAGDKRILLIDGEPYPYALARVPQGKDWRGNLAKGAKGKVIALSERDKEICAALRDELKKRGLYFVGIDVIGDYLTEVNVTSPTGIRELDTALNDCISAKLMDCLEEKLSLLRSA